MVKGAQPPPPRFKFLATPQASGPQNILRSTACCELYGEHMIYANKPSGSRAADNDEDEDDAVRGRIETNINRPRGSNFCLRVSTKVTTQDGLFL